MLVGVTCHSALATGARFCAVVVLMTASLGMMFQGGVKAGAVCRVDQRKWRSDGLGGDRATLSYATPYYLYGSLGGRKCV